MSASDTYDVVLVGAGFSGLYSLHRLRQEGYRVRLVEAAPELGGVWYWNSYPGARVDSRVPNYEYSLETVWRDWNWSERFPGRDELLDYFRHVDDVLDLTPDIDLETRVTAARFDETDRRWSIETDCRGTYRAQFFILCTGFASKPFVPDLPGLDAFAGECHHTARWPAEGVDLAGRRVGIIGTGASGVQVLQEASHVADHVTVFQRTPVTALPMEQRAMTPADNAEMKRTHPAFFERRNSPPGSFGDLFRRPDSALDATREERATVYEEAWRKGGFNFWVGTYADILTDTEANRTAYDFWRRKVHERVHDPRTAELLAPAEPPYAFGTKRPSLEQDYYAAFNLDTVELVDLHTDPIVAITAGGVRTEATAHPCDLLVLATGFDANTGGLTQIDLVDTTGTSMAARWSDGVDTQLGLAVDGFPNLFFLYGPQSPTAFCNGPTCAEHQGEWLVDCLNHLRDHGLTRMEARHEATLAWTEHVEDFAAMTLFPRTDSWYTAANIPGKRRQMLNHPSADDYLVALRENASEGYPGFDLD